MEPQSKLMKVVVVVVALAIIIVGVWILNKGNKKSAQQTAVQQAQQAAVVPSVSDQIPETNPFKVDVNPYNSYKNPFGQ